MFIAQTVLSMVLSASGSTGIIPHEWKVGEVKILVIGMPEARVGWTRTRPRKDNPEMMMAIPAAYTGKNGKTEGFIMDRGVLVSKRPAGTYTGAAIICSGSVKIIGSGLGAQFDEDFIERHRKAKCSVFEQQLLVRDGKPQDYDASTEMKFQRRALVRFKNGNAAIIQSGPPMTKTDFAKLLSMTCDQKDVCISDALNLDMGDYSEGWYRGSSGDINILSAQKATSKQSNWLVIRYERG